MTQTQRPTGLPALLAAAAARDPAAPALLAPGRPPLPYGELLDLVARTGRRLRELGHGPRDRLALVLPNGPAAATAFLAVASHLAAAPLNPGYPATELEFYLRDLGAAGVVAPAGGGEASRQAAAAVGLPVLELVERAGAAAGDFELLGSPGGPPAAGEAGPTEIALLLHTSGTTARPKLVPLTQANLCVSAGHTATSLGLGPADRALNVMPLFHIHGLVGCLLASLSVGAAVVCAPGFFAPDFLGWLAESGATWYTAVPTVHQAVLEQAGRRPELLPGLRLRLIRSCSAALPPPLLEALQKTFGVPVLEAYGMTEAAHQMASNPLPPRPCKPGSVGPAAGPAVAIMGGDGGLLPVGETGEVVVRGPNVTGGYLANPAANQASFINGWFRTGDEGYLDSEGYLFLTGRLKEMINRAGEKIAPREVDEALLAHPAVAQAVAFALPDPRLGEEVAAAVVLREGAAATERELQEVVAGRLADFKVPRRIVFLAELPKGPTGKLQRIGLAERLGLAAEAAAPTPYVAPATPLEQGVAAIWAEVLRLAQVGAATPFAELGGDSMLATRVLARLRAAYGVELTMRDLAAAPTVQAQALLVLERQAAGLDPAELERLLAAAEGEGADERA